MLIPLVSAGVSITLLPVVLDAIGTRLEWPRRRPAGTVSRLWTRVARFVVAHRLASALGALVALGVLIAPVFSLNLGQPQATATAATAPAQARAGLEALTAGGIGPGVLRPTEILTPTAPPPLAGVTTVAPPSWTRGGLRSSTPGRRRPLDPRREGRPRLRSRRRRPPGTRRPGRWLPAQDADFITALYGRNLLIIVAAIVVVTTAAADPGAAVVWLPVKACCSTSVSLAAAFGVLTFVWQEGHGTHALFASPATGAVTLWVPLAVFALLFGLSMDYEVFILTRINEEYAHRQTPTRPSSADRPHRPAGHLRRPDPVPGLHRPRRSTGNRRQDPLYRAGRRHHHRRHRHPRRPRARPRRPARPVQLVATPPPGAGPADCTTAPRDGAARLIRPTDLIE